jgi:hypothetical protein
MAAQVAAAILEMLANERKGSVVADVSVALMALKRCRGTSGLGTAATMVTPSSDGCSIRGRQSLPLGFCLSSRALLPFWDIYIEDK